MKTISPKPNWNGETKWLKLHSVEVITCCDCGLAHTFKFKSDGKNVWWRAKRNKEVTKEMRKKYHSPLTYKKKRTNK